MAQIRVIGLTGQTGAGKTLVSSMLYERGYAVIDCDEVSREVVRAGTECLAELVSEFGVGILQSDATLNRRRLGEIAFGDKTKLARLNAIIFPHIHQAIEDAIAELDAAGVRAVFLDAPTLFESGADKKCSQIVSVIAPLAVRKRRIMERDGLRYEQAKERIASQHADTFYTSRSDFVICNDAGKPELLVLVLEMLSTLGLNGLETEG